MSVEDGRRRMGEDPFAALSPLDQVRRLRGQMAAPVTVWTAGGAAGEPATGITVSSVMVAEGEPASILGLVGPLSDFWEAAGRSKRFVVHVLGSGQLRLADQFAGRYPGDPFEGLRVSTTPWGPVLDDVGTRVTCSLSSFLEVGYQLLVRGEPVGITVADVAAPPLVHYRGRYLTVAARPQGY